MKKIIGLFLALVTALSFTACKPSSPSGSYEDDTMSYSRFVENVKTTAQLTGKKAVTDTLSNWQIGGTDLGFPIYNSTNDTMYIAFGDTFRNPENMTGGWRSNVLGISRDFDLSDGLAFDGFLESREGIAGAVIEGMHADDGTEVTKIPTGGIKIDGAMYLFYMSVRQWTTPGEWLVNYCAAVKSVDQGRTWERVYDLTWINDMDERLTAQAVSFANRDANNRENVGGVAAEGRVSDNFMQIFPIDGKDGYIYLFAIPQGRSGGAKLARVKRDSFEDFSAYEYFTGRKDGAAVYAQGSDGLSSLKQNDDSYIILPTTGEVSVMYNEYLKKWTAIYYTKNTVSFCMADEIDGTYSLPETLITNSEYAGLYGGMCHEKYSKNQGKTFYFFLSQWMPTYNTFVIEVELV